MHACMQVSTRTRASSSSAVHPSTPSQQQSQRVRPFLHPPRHDDVAPPQEDADLVSVVEEGQLEEAEQWCRFSPRFLLPFYSAVREKKQR